MQRQTLYRERKSDIFDCFVRKTTEVEMIVFRNNDVVGCGLTGTGMGVRVTKMYEKNEIRVFGA